MEESVFRGGSGPRLLLLHSGFTTWREWRCVLGRLTRERDVLAPTLPLGQGGARLDMSSRSMLQAMADDVERRLDAVGWTAPVAVAGGSHGAVAALELAARGRATSVVAFAPPWMTPRSLVAYGSLFTFGSLLLRATWPVHLLTSRSPYAAGVVLHGEPARTAMGRDDLVSVLRGVRSFPLLEGRHAFRAPLLPDFAAIDVPVTLAWGTADRLAPPSMARAWTRALPHAELVWLDGFPHVPQLRDPDRIADLLLDRLEGC